MKIVALLDSVSRLNGGIFHAERNRLRALARTAGMTIEVLGVEDRFSASDLSSWHPLVPRVFPAIGLAAFGYSPRLKTALLRTDVDLVHSAGLWKYPSVAASRWHDRTRKPHLISPHGMLDEWALHHSGWKKKCAAALYENAHLKSAACLHALCSAEAEAFRNYGLKNPVCLIPNGVDLPARCGPLSALRLSPISQGKRILLYLGRLHPKKGLSNLIHSWGQVSKRHKGEWLLAIAGWDQSGHELELQRQATSLGIGWSDIIPQEAGDTSVFFLGPQYDAIKAACYRDCDAFILPSFSEGLPLVILESWAHGKPVLMTPECHFPDGFDRHAALRIESTVESICDGLQQLFDMSSTDRQIMGEKGLSLVQERYLWPSIAEEMKSVYEWILGDGPMPGCVRSK